MSTRGPWDSCPTVGPGARRASRSSACSSSRAASARDRPSSGPVQRTDAGTSADAGPSRDAGLLGDAGPSADAGASADAGPAPTCLTEISCVTDLQCASVPGSVCNPGLSPARCQRLGCGEEGSPCGSEELRTFSPGGTGDDALCADGHCRHPGPGPFVCRARPLDAAECLASCAGWSELASCSEEPPCERLCADAREACQAHDGLSDVRASSSCGAGGKAICTDGELFSF